MKPLVASHTFLNTFERCPKQAFHCYVAKDLPFVESDAMRWGNVVHNGMENRLKHNQPLPETCKDYEPFAQQLENMNVSLLVEFKMGIKADGSFCDFFAPDVWMRGKADVIVLPGANAFLLDWKTGKRREDAAELERFAVMARARFPLVEKFLGAYVWLKDLKMGQTHDLNDTERRLAYDRRLMEQAQELRKRGGEWPAHENGLCRQYCDVMSCQFNGRRG